MYANYLVCRIREFTLLGCNRKCISALNDTTSTNRAYFRTYRLGSRVASGRTGTGRHSSTTQRSSSTDKRSAFSCCLTVTLVYGTPPPHRHMFMRIRSESRPEPTAEKVIKLLIGGVGGWRERGGAVCSLEYILS